MKNLEIINARLHNLKNIDITIPKNRFVVATGISGSGKSSLIFDTIFEEGKKLYLDSIGFASSYRDGDVVDQINGIAPTVAVMQKIIREKNPRSLVGTKTGISNLLATLFSIEGEYPCKNCNTPVKGWLKCPNCGEHGNGLIPAYFQFTSPKGMCFTCDGRGYKTELDLEKFIPDENETLEHLWGRTCYYPKKYTKGKVQGFIDNRAIEYKEKYGISADIKLKDLPRAIKKRIYYDKKMEFSLPQIFAYKLYRNKISDNDPYYKTEPCTVCNGHRVGDIGLKTKFNGLNIGEMCNLDISSLYEHLKSSESNVNSSAAKKVIYDILKKLNNMMNLGLSYLNLYRMMPTLSGGEVQRLLIMHHLENELEGLIYIFDEPTAGLHESEKQLLIDKAKELQAKGNSIIIVEHDYNIINQAEYLIDFGPGAGSHGGEIIYEGLPVGIYNIENSYTGKFLSGELKVLSRNSSDKKQIDHNTDYLNFKNITLNNLKNINVNIPLNCIVGVCGVSGSGKTSLVNGAVVPTLKKFFKNRSEDEDDSIIFGSEKIVEFSGGKSLKSISVVTQSPIGRSSISNIATYLGVWDDIRKHFVNTLGKDKYKIGDFSFNSKGGCKHCGGRGEEIFLLSNNFTMRNTCRVCNGMRYTSEILDLKVNGKNIKEVLDLTVEEAIAFFIENETVHRKLKTFEKTGMGYITLGQSTTTISGGEAQRLKLAKQLITKKKGHVLYIFDEPTTGLSMHDINKFLKMIYELFLEGNSIIIIEHDLDVLNFCEHIIELGPQGGENGGYIIAEGSPEDIKINTNSITGKYLKEYKGEYIGIS